MAQSIYYSTSMATPSLVSVRELLIWSLIFREYITDAGVDVGARRAGLRRCWPIFRRATARPRLNACRRSYQTRFSRRRAMPCWL